MKYKYRIKKPFQAGFFVLLAFGFLLALGKWGSVFRPGFVIINAEIHSHISNFILSLIVYLGTGYSWLLSGVSFRRIAFLGVFMTAANFICETFMGFMNTTDIVDAIYGTAGILVGFIYLSLCRQYALIPEELKES